MRSRVAIAVVRGLRELRSSGRSQTQRVRAGSVFMRPAGGVRSATSGRRTQRQLARAVWARSLRAESIERKDWDNDGTNSAMSQVEHERRIQVPALLRSSDRQGKQMREVSGPNASMGLMRLEGRKPYLTENRTCASIPSFEVNEPCGPG